MHSTHTLPCRAMAAASIVAAAPVGMAAQVAQVAAVVAEACQDKVERKSANVGWLLVQEAQRCLLQQHGRPPILLLHATAHPDGHQASSSPAAPNQGINPLNAVAPQDSC